MTKLSRCCHLVTKNFSVVVSHNKAIHTKYNSHNIIRQKKTSNQKGRRFSPKFSLSHFLSVLWYYTFCCNTHTYIFLQAFEQQLGSANTIIIISFSLLLILHIIFCYKSRNSERETDIHNGSIIINRGSKAWTTQKQKQQWWHKEGMKDISNFECLFIIIVFIIDYFILCQNILYPGSTERREAYHHTVKQNESSRERECRKHMRLWLWPL